MVVVTGAISDSFMRDDLRLIHQFADATTLELDKTGPRGGGVFRRVARGLLNFARYAYRLLRSDVRVVVFWFASTNYAPAMAAIAKLLRVKVMVITGGKDAVYVRDIDWGDMKSGWHRFTFGVLMRMSDAVLPFSDSAKRLITEHYRPKHMRTVYPSVDADYFLPSSGARKRRAVTCCYQYSSDNIVQKGLDLFVAAAEQLPDVEFVLVGDGVDDAARRLTADAPKNVTVLPRIPGRAGYRDVLAESSAYVQLSAHEGFGVSVAEAMACGSVPVVSDRFSLPEVVGGAGHVVPYGNVDDAVRAIRSAVYTPDGARAAARDRVAQLFSREVRARALREEFVGLIPELASQPLRIELGCGSTGVAGAIGVDMRQTVQTSAVCDVRHSCFKSGIADEVYSFCVLEHLDDPYELMDEVVRILKPGGRAYLRVPNIGTFSSHLDTTHRFLADLRIWRGVMEGYFESVTVVPEGTKYRDNRLLTTINSVLVKGLHFYELTQGWTFVCERKRAVPAKSYLGWWQESEPDR